MEDTALFNLWKKSKDNTTIAYSVHRVNVTEQASVCSSELLYVIIRYGVQFNTV